MELPGGGAFSPQHPTSLNFSPSDGGPAALGDDGVHAAHASLLPRAGHHSTHHHHHSHHHGRRQSDFSDGDHHDGGLEEGGQHESACWETARTVGAIVKSFIGSGILFLPKAFEDGGLVASIVVMIAMALLTQVTILRLVECRQKVVGSYAYVGLQAAGRWAEASVNIALVLSQAGFCCVYIAFIARNVLQLLNVHSCWAPGQYLWVLVLLQFPILAPLSWIRRIKTFGITNVLANAFIGLGLFGILLYCIVDWAKAPNPTSINVPAFNKSGFALFLGTAVYAYEGIGMVVPIVDSLSPRAARVFPWTLSVTLLGIAGMYIIIGLIPYMYMHGVAGVPIADTITLNLPNAWWAYMIIAAYCIALVFSYGLMLFPAVKILERGAAPYLGLRKGKGCVDHWKRNAFRAGIVAVTLAVSYLGSSQLNNLVALVGCFACTPLAFIFPCIFHLRLIPQTLYTWVSNWLIIIFGCGVFVFSTYQAIAGWSIATVDACVYTGQ